MRQTTLLAGACIAAFSLTSAPSAHSAEAAAEAPRSTVIQEVVVTAERRSQSVQKSSLAISVHSGEDATKAGVVQMRDLVKLDPGIQIGQGGPATNTYIRGVGNFGSTSIANPAVATNMDGVYISRENAIEGNFHDLARIEVLKGPQGTLYGRNASGGAINLISNPPKLQTSEGHLELEGGNYNLVRAQGALNVPLGDDFAVRGAFQVISRKGYSSDGFDDDRQQAFRLSVLWKPNEDFSLRMTGDVEHIGGNGPGYLVKGRLAPSVVAAYQANHGLTVGGPYPFSTERRLSVTDPRAAPIFYAALETTVFGLCLPNGVLPAASATRAGTLVFTPTVPIDTTYCATRGGPGSTQVYTSPNGALKHEDNLDFNYTAQMDWNLGFATLTVLPAFRGVRNDYVTFPFGPFTSYGIFPGSGKELEKSDTYSLEARLGSTTEQLTWVAGVYIYRENQRVPSGFGPGVVETTLFLGPTNSLTHITTRAQAVFGQATYSVTDQWRIILGGRYGKDRKSLDSTQVAYDTPFAFFFARTPPAPPLIGAGTGLCFGKASPCVVQQFGGDHSWNKFTYKIGTEYDITPQNMLFVTYATGNKTGGFNQFVLRPYTGDPNAVRYEPEALGALEVGSRNRFLDSRLQVNLEGFYFKYKNAQELFAFTNTAGQGSFGAKNVGSATVYGGSASVVARLTPVDTFTGGFEYLHTNINDFVYQTQGYTPLQSGCIITPTFNPAAPATPQTIDCSGKPLTHAPKYSATASYTHTFELASGATVDAAVNGQFASSREIGQADYTPGTHAARYAVGNVLLTYNSPRKNWSITGYIRNITNAHVYTGSFVAPGNLPSLTLANLGPPRTYGAYVAIDF